MGIYISCFAFLAGFAIVWQIIWLIIIGLIGVIACMIIFPLMMKWSMCCPLQKLPRLKNLTIEDNRLWKMVSDTKVFGFWVYLMTDLVIFAVLFACFIVLHENTFNGPSAKELFHLPSVLAETLILLTSSFTCSLGMLAVHRRLKNGPLSGSSYFSFGSFLSLYRNFRICQFCKARSQLATQRFSLFVFYIGRHSWISYYCRIIVDGRYDVSHRLASTCGA